MVLWKKCPSMTLVHFLTGFYFDIWELLASRFQKLNRQAVCKSLPHCAGGHHTLLLVSFKGQTSQHFDQVWFAKFLFSLDCTFWLNLRTVCPTLNPQNQHVFYFFPKRVLDLCFTSEFVIYFEGVWFLYKVWIEIYFAWGYILILTVCLKVSPSIKCLCLFMKKIWTGNRAVVWMKMAHLTSASLWAWSWAHIQVTN